MAILDWKDNISCWLRPESLANLPLAPAITDLWNDSSGNDRDFIFSGAAGLTIVHDAANGYPCVQFDGTAGYLGYFGSLSDLIANNAGTVFSVFKPLSFGTNDSNPALNDAVWAANSASGAGVYLRSVPEVVAFNDDGTNDQRVNAIVANTLYFHMWRHRTGRLTGLIDDPLIYTDIASGNTTSVNVDVFLGKNHEATPKFGHVQLYEQIFLNIGMEDHDAAIPFNYLLAKFGGRGDAHGQALGLGARALWELREPTMSITVPDLPPSALDVDAGDEIALVHPDVPHPTGAGAGVKNWERLPLVVREIRPNLDTLKVQLVGQRVRKCTFSLACKAVAVPGQGLAITGFSPGPYLSKRVVQGTQVVAADGKAWFERGADGLVSELRDGELKIGPNGLRLEIGARNQILRSAFASGSPSPTGWTLTQPTTGGSVASELVADAGFSLWDTAITTRCLKFVRGSLGDGMASVGVGAPQTSTDQGVLQIDARGVPGGAAWQLVNNNTTHFFDNSTGTWVVAGTTNPIDADPSEFRQTVSKPIVYEDNSAMTLTLIQTGVGGAANDVIRFFYVGLVYEQLIIPTASPRLRWPISRIFSDQASSTVHMGQDHGPIFPNHSGARNFNNARGSLNMRLRHSFNTSDVVNVDSTALKFVLLHVYHDANNEVLLHYYRDSAGAVAEYRLDVKAAGTTYRAVFPFTVVRYAEVNLWARWTSASDGELGLPARTLTLGVNGVAGVDVQAAAYPTEAAQSFMGIGSWAAPSPPSHYVLSPQADIPNLEIYAECPLSEVLSAWRF